MGYCPHVTEDVREMLDVIGAKSIDDLFEDIPKDVRLERELKLPRALSEPELRRRLGELASCNHAGMVSFLGGGCYDHFIPAVVDVLASRGEFLTCYTPYQAEASQGSLQAFFEFQTLICRLTGCEVSNASMYDGASAVAEAVLMCLGAGRSNVIAVDAGLHPEYRRVLSTYLHHLETEVIPIDHTVGRIDTTALKSALARKPGVVVVQSPDFFGVIHDLAPIVESVHEAGALLIAAVDPISLGLLKRPGELGVDVVAGEGQSLGSPQSFGGPGLGFLAASTRFTRKMPGRLVGETTDNRGRRGFVLTLQTREQHIRRGKATSNICTNHALNALRAAIYLSLMGPQGLRRVAELCLAKAHYAANALRRLPGVSLLYDDAPFFKEFAIQVEGMTAVELRSRLIKDGIDPGLDLGRFDPDTSGLEHALLVAVTENRTREEIDRMVQAIGRELKS